MKTDLLTFIAGIVIGILAVLLFIGVDSPARPATTTTIVNPAAIIDYTKKVEKHFKEKIDSLQTVNASLQQKVGNTQSALQQSRQKSRSLEQEINQLIEINERATDTAELLNNCDSLAGTVQELVTESMVKDSLCESLTSDLWQQLSTKDSIIILQHQQYDTLKGSFDQVLVQQQELISVNQQQNKQLVKQRKGKKLLSMLLFVFGGIHAYRTIQ